MGKIYHHVSPWVNQYRQYVVFTFSTIQVPWYSFVLVSQSNYHAMYNWSNNCWWGHDGQSIFRVIFACGITGHHSFRVQLVSDVPRPKKNYHRMSTIPVLFQFLKISLVGTSQNMKPMPGIFLFSDARDSLSNMWIFIVTIFW